MAAKRYWRRWWSTTVCLEILHSLFHRVLFLLLRVVNGGGTSVVVIWALGIGVSMLGVSMEIKRRSGALLCAGCYSRDLAIHDFHGFGLEDIVLI
ncbi:hypothetical protein TSUD_369420 [Trifolium subterraneum]|uniref:Transmembrane protein n=1 Tax=Trifolium subterraneum TaxID=3900 RepID=A0A2Z6NVI3_TRISU|nr:hypothetical protein TSUD_369420 [Trifolium subterraneum]